jgi:anthranilate synthase component 2
MHCLLALLPNPFVATRYHSLAIELESLSDDFEMTAWADAPDGGREVMGIRHRQHLIEGLQFHPESFLTACGPDILQRFLNLR